MDPRSEGNSYALGETDNKPRLDNRKLIFSLGKERVSALSISSWYCLLGNLLKMEIPQQDSFDEFSIYQPHAEVYCKSWCLRIIIKESFSIQQNLWCKLILFKFISNAWDINSSTKNPCKHFNLPCGRIRLCCWKYAVMRWHLKRQYTLLVVYI